MTEKNRVSFFFFGQCMATVFFRLCVKLVKMKLLKFQKPVLVYAIRESFFFFIFFPNPEKTNICLAEHLKLTFIMFLKYKHSTFAWDFSLQLIVKVQVKRKKKKRERE